MHDKQPKIIIPIKAIQTLYWLLDVLDKKNIWLLQWIRPEWKRQFTKKFLRFTASHTSRTITHNGIIFNLPETLDFSLVAGNHESETMEYIENTLHKGMTVVDIGANIGWFTAQMAQLVGPTGKVYAIEPSPENVALLRKNIQANNLENVTVLPYAIGAKRSQRHLYTAGVGTVHTLHAAENRTSEKTVVTEYSIDEIIDEPIDFIKMDIEGSEIDALAGMKCVQKRNPALQMIVEWNPACLRRAGHRPEQLPLQLQKEGFRLAILDHETTRTSSWQDIVTALEAGQLEPSWHVNLLAVPKD